ncbi:MAG: NAD(P)/FAD-dependent oxidoreductase [Marinagarivorans sp.]|nr:NAD(P)/FAD-dependent oxidoreductase [Marinagarivorans sp.]
MQLNHSSPLLTHFNDKETLDCIIIGGGAAGLMCAAQAAMLGKNVTVLDHSNKVGKKILMSGGGRCNFTNYNVEPNNYLGTNIHFCKSALARFNQYDFLDLVHKHQIPYHEKTLGQLFCDNKASDILNLLLHECDNNGVKIYTHCSINRIAALAPEQNTSARFRLTTSLGNIRCKSLVIATGGLSIPTMGATGFGYDIAKQFGLKITPRLASLVPFTFKGKTLATAQALAGVALPVAIYSHSQDQIFKEALLFTHKGISGPAVLQISNYWLPDQTVTINFLPELILADQIEQWKNEGQKAEVKNLLTRHLPKRFISEWLLAEELTSIGDKTLADLSRSDIDALTTAFNRWTCVPAGTEGYKTAEVTRGGINTDEVSSKTFEAKKVPGLFFIGEVLDVTGWLGGFNFQWAWASGYCAAQFV